MTKHSSWDTESGLLDDYDFVVDEAWFGEDEEADNPTGKIYLFLRGTATDDEGEEYDEHRERYSTGKNWEVVGDGEEVENASGKHRFNQNAGIGRLINALVALGDDEAAFLQARGQAYEAATFEGLRMHMEQKLVSRWENPDYDADDDDSKKWLEWRLNIPTSLTMKKKKSKAKGKGGSGKAGRSKVKGKATKAKKAKSPKSGLRSEVAEFAGQFGEDEHDEFVDQVLDSDVFPNADSIMDDDELHADVLDPDSDMWEQAH